MGVNLEVINKGGQLNLNRFRKKKNGEIHYLYFYWPWWLIAFNAVQTVIWPVSSLSGRGRSEEKERTKKKRRPLPQSTLGSLRSLIYFRTFSPLPRLLIG